MFDYITKDDIILAFFPCVRFEAQITMGFRGEMNQQKRWSDERKLIYSMQLHDELNLFYHRLSQLVVICLRKGLKCIIENPWTQPHYLRQYWCIKPSLVDTDRTMRGDFFKKPTQFFFINCEPKNNLLFEAMVMQERHTHLQANKMDNGNTRQVNRSLISKEYANRFIREYILEGNNESP